MAEPSIPPGFDFTDPDLYVQPGASGGAGRAAPHRAGLVERRSRAAPPASTTRATGWSPGTRTCWRCPAASDVYSSQQNTAIIRHGEPVTDETLAMMQLILLNIDPPQHTKLRGIVSRGFTPRAIENLRDALTDRAEADRARRWPRAPATSSPTSPASCRCRPSPSCSACRRRTGARSSTGPTRWSATTTRSTTGTRTAAAAELVGYSMVMAEDRRGCPRDDIVTKLVNAAGRRRRPVLGRVRLLRDPAGRGGQRDHP